MQNAPTPAAPLATGAERNSPGPAAASAAAGAAARHAAAVPLPVGAPATGRAPAFELPDLCSPIAVFGVVLACELLAVLLALARQPAWPAFFGHLAQISLLLLWIGLLSAASLCRLRPWLRSFPLVQGSILTFLIVMVNVAVVSEGAWWLGQALAAEPDGPWFPREHLGFVTRNLAIGAIVMAPVLRYFYVSTEWQRNVRRQAEARLVALQARIRPHFLFNSMNTIAALTRTNPAAAEQAVEDLADLFRAALRESRDLIPLGEEIDVARVYERMEQQRLGPRLAVEWALDGLPADALVPGLTIQPLLENAIGHGIEPLRTPGVIRVRGERDGDRIRIVVTNPVPQGPVREQPGHRMALENIRERLELAFGNQASLELQRTPAEFSATISFPCRFAAADGRGSAH